MPVKMEIPKDLLQLLAKEKNLLLNIVQFVKKRSQRYISKQFKKSFLMPQSLISLKKQLAHVPFVVYTALAQISSQNHFSTSQDIREQTDKYKEI